MVTLKLTEHEAKVLKLLLASDKNEYLSSLKWSIDGLEDEHARLTIESKRLGKLMKHTTDAVVVMNSVLSQL